MRAISRGTSLDSSIRRVRPVLSILERPHVAEGARAHPSAAIRAAAFASAGSIAFLVNYGVLHAMHVARIHARPVQALSSIPLFACCLGSLPLAILVGALAACFAPHAVTGWRKLPLLFAAVVTLFTAEILLFP